ncbi:MAG: hypothetical protein JNK05_19770 [Myxococcales bacterium]|nr:hypothetical protein [Myxococcales bacterium]
MRSKAHSWIAVCSTAAAIVATASGASAQAQPRYLAQMQAELQVMGLAAQCSPTSATVGACSFRGQAPGPDGRTANPTARQFVVAMTYDDGSDTIYVYVERYATLRADAANVAQASRRLLEINWETLSAKMEWSPTSGEVRLSALLHTDSNFDRRAFRSVVRSVLRVADRYAAELSQLTGGPVGEAPRAPTANAPANPAQNAAPAQRPTASDAGAR